MASRCFSIAGGSLSKFSHSSTRRSGGAEGGEKERVPGALAASAPVGSPGGAGAPAERAWPGSRAPSAVRSPGAPAWPGPGQLSTCWVPTTQRSCAPQPGARGPQGTERPRAVSQSPIKPASFLQTQKSALRGEVLYCLLSFPRQRGASGGDTCALRMMETKIRSAVKCKH